MRLSSAAMTRMFGLSPFAARDVPLRSPPPPTGASLEELVAAFERDVIGEALRTEGGNVAAAARRLRTTPRILAYRARQIGLDPKTFSPRRRSAGEGETT